MSAEADEAAAPAVPFILRRPGLDDVRGVVCTASAPATARGVRGARRGVTDNLPRTEFVLLGCIAFPGFFEASALTERGFELETAAFVVRAARTGVRFAGGAAVVFRPAIRIATGVAVVFAREPAALRTVATVPALLRETARAVVFAAAALPRAGTAAALRDGAARVEALRVVVAPRAAAVFTGVRVDAFDTARAGGLLALPGLTAPATCFAEPLTARVFAVFDCDTEIFALRVVRDGAARPEVAAVRLPPDFTAMARLRPWGVLLSSSLLMALSSLDCPLLAQRHQSHLPAQAHPRIAIRMQFDS